MTLVEVIVAMTVFTIIMLSLLPAFEYVFKLNVVSKAGVDTTTIAQQEAETFYLYSKSMSFAKLVDPISSPVKLTYSPYEEPLYSGIWNLSRTYPDSNVEVTITMWNNNPQAGMTKIRIVAVLVNNSQGALSEQIDSILLFKP